MLAISDAQIEEVARVIGAEGASEAEIESGVLALVQDPLLARRLIDWMPEAFGMVLVSHMDAVALPTGFFAKNDRGDWVEFDLRAEPIVASAIRLALHLYHNGPRNTFSNIAVRSSVICSVNRALNDGASLKDATLSGPSMMGIPAETYLSPKPSIWRKLFR